MYVKTTAESTAPLRRVHLCANTSVDSTAQVSYMNVKPRQWHILQHLAAQWRQASRCVPKQWQCHCTNCTTEKDAELCAKTLVDPTESKSFTTEKSVRSCAKAMVDPTKVLKKRCPTEKGKDLRTTASSCTTETGEGLCAKTMTMVHACEMTRSQWSTGL